MEKLAIIVMLGTIILLLTILPLLPKFKLVGHRLYYKSGVMTEQQKSGVVLGWCFAALFIALGAIVLFSDAPPMSSVKYSIKVRVDADGFLAGTSIAHMYCQSYKKTDNRIICFGAAGQILDDISFPDRALVDISMIK